MRVFVRIRICRIGEIYRISFAITANPAKAITDERLPVKDELIKS